MKRNSLVFLLAAATLSCSIFGCAGVPPSPLQMDDPPPGPTNVPLTGHVALVIFENQKFEPTFGNTHMPYLTGLAKQNAYAAQFFANTHPSLGNYFVLTTGQIISNDLNFSGVVLDDNLIRQINKAGKTWKAYEEDLPRPGFVGDGPLPYVKTHNPAAYLFDVRSDPLQAANLVPLTQLQADMDAGNLPNFMFIEPNQINSMHDCPPPLAPNCPDNNVRLATGDAWAQKVLAPLLNNPQFQQDGLLIITWDESYDNDDAHGGGHVLTLFVGTKVKQQFVSNNLYQHESILRTICDALHIPTMAPAAGAPNMEDMFVGN